MLVISQPVIRMNRDNRVMHSVYYLMYECVNLPTSIHLSMVNEYDLVLGDGMLFLLLELCVLPSPS